MRSLSIFMLCCTLAACSKSEPIDLRGYLYFASGSYVGRFNLRDGSSSIVANMGDVTVNTIDSLDTQKLLVSMVSFAAEREMPRISSLDIKTGRMLDLLGGSNASYLSATDTIVYDDGTRVVETSLRRRPKSYEEVFSHKHNSSVALRPITNDSVLFSIRDEDISRTYYFNSKSREGRELGRLSSTCSLQGAVWIPTINRIACKGEPGTAEQAYVLASLDGKDIDPIALPKGEEMSALIYIPGQDVLVFVERRRSLFSRRDKWRVWAHDFASGKNHILSENQYLGSSVVYWDN